MAEVIAPIPNWVLHRAITSCRTINQAEKLSQLALLMPGKGYSAILDRLAASDMGNGSLLDHTTVFFSSGSKMATAIPL